MRWVISYAITLESVQIRIVRFSLACLWFQYLGYFGHDHFYILFYLSVCLETRVWSTVPLSGGGILNTFTFKLFLNRCYNLRHCKKIFNTGFHKTNKRFQNDSIKIPQIEFVKTISSLLLTFRKQSRFGYESSRKSQAWQKLTHLEVL